MAIDYLGSFTCLNPSVYLREPLTTNRPSKTIILCSWMNASAQYIATYTTGYINLDPSARIILVRNTVANFLYRSLARQKADLAPVVSALCARPDDAVFAHTFSNAGAQRLSVLAAMFRERTGRMLPLRGMIFDSNPSIGSASRAKPMLMYELPHRIYFRVPGIVLVYVLLSVMWVWDQVLRHENVLNRARDALNDPSLISRDAPRIYIYSETDRLVRWEDVEEHCAAAAAKGWKVTRERFPGSAHVRHVKLDAERYWGIAGRLLAL